MALTLQPMLPTNQLGKYIGPYYRYSISELAYTVCWHRCKKKLQQMNVLQDAFEQRLINLVDFLEICFHFDIKSLLINVKEDFVTKQ